MSIVDKLTKEKIEKCKNVFDSYDTNKTGFIPCSKLSYIFRCLGVFIPNDELEAQLEDRELINFDKFINIFEEYYTKIIEPKKIIEGFQLIDKDNTGKIKSSDLLHAITVIGDKLSESEANDFLKIFTNKNGLINCKELAEEISKS